MAWEITQRPEPYGAATQQWVISDKELNEIVLVDQLADFDAWRVGGGVAFRW